MEIAYMGVAFVRHIGPPRLPPHAAAYSGFLQPPVRGLRGAQDLNSLRFIFPMRCGQDDLVRTIRRG
jgi:hypothetical protein